MSQISNEFPNSASDSTSVFSELFRAYELSQIIYCGLDRTNRGNDGKTLLFNSSLIAKEAANVLRGDWDGLNAVTVHQPKVVAHYENSLIVEYAGESVKLELREREIEFCRQGQYCFLNQLTMPLKAKAHGGGKSMIISELMMKALEGEMEKC